METDSNQKGGKKRRDAQGRKDAGSNTQNKEEDKLAKKEQAANQRNIQELDDEIDEEYNIQNRFDLEPNNYISTETKKKEFGCKSITYYFNRQSTLYMDF